MSTQKIPERLWNDPVGGGDTEGAALLRFASALARSHDALRLRSGRNTCGRALAVQLGLRPAAWLRCSPDLPTLCGCVLAVILHR